MQQLTCPANAHIVKGAVILSGMIDMENADGDIFNPIDLKDAEKRGVAFFDYIGVKSLEEARAIDAKKLRDLYGQYSCEGMALKMFPIVDGNDYNGNPQTLLVEGSCPDVPIITGYTSDEFTFDNINVVERTVKKCVKKGLEVNKEKNLNRKFYSYCFDPDIPGFDDPGTFHSVDLWFWFETLSKCWRPFKGRHYDLASQMSSYFVNFIKTGNPNGKDYDGTDLPLWKNSEEDSYNIMTFTSEGAKPE